MKKRSPIRQLLRFIRFAIAIPLLSSVWKGGIEWWVGLLLYVGLWIVFIAVDAPIAYREWRLTQRGADLSNVPPLTMFCGHDTDKIVP